MTDDPDPATSAPFTPIGEAVEAYGRGEIVCVVDDADRENEGDLIVAAQFATAEKVAFMVRHTSGLICVPLTDERCRRLELEPMAAANTDAHGTAFMTSVDLAVGTTTGISAADRAATARALADPDSSPSDFTRPGHMFPLRARPGGVLKRAGHTEAAVDLARLAGVEPVAVISELVNDDGSMARLPDLRRFAAAHGLPLIPIADLVAHRYRHDRLIRRVGVARLPTVHGDFECFAYESTLDGIEHLAFVYGSLSEQDDVLVRVHSECITGDVFGSLRCDCGDQLRHAMAAVAAEGAGAVVYLRGHEGRGIGLGHKIQAYALQQAGYDTVDANVALGLPVDSREYGIGAQILADLGITRLRLMTNNPAKYGGLGGYGLEIVGRVPMPAEATVENLAYLETKRSRMGHLLDFHEQRGDGSA